MRWGRKGRPEPPRLPIPPPVLEDEEERVEREDSLDTDPESSKYEEGDIGWDQDDGHDHDGTNEGGRRISGPNLSWSGLTTGDVYTATSATTADFAAPAGGGLDADVIDRLAGCTVTAGTETANVITMTVQFVDFDGNALAERMIAWMWLASAQYQTSPLVQPSGGWVLGANGYEIVDMGGELPRLMGSDANGVLKVDVTHGAAATFHLHVIVLNKVYIGTMVFT